MQVIEKTNLRMLIADDGKHIRSINDEYIPAHEENGELIEEHFPQYSEVIFLGIQVDVNEISSLYVEEDIQDNAESPDTSEKYSGG